LSLLSDGRRLPRWIARLAEGDLETLHHLGTTPHEYHAKVIDPIRDQVNVVLNAEYVRRARVLLHGGTDALLSSLEPPLHWEPPILHTDYPVEQHLRLDGRGLLLVPSFFCWRNPVALADPNLPPVLVYPVDHGLFWQDNCRTTTTSHANGASS
jgi:hypothetical protein